MAQPGKIYARAVYEYAGGGAAAVDAAAGLRAFWDMCLENDVLMAAATRQGVPSASRVALVGSVAEQMGLDRLSLRVLLILARASRLSLLPMLVEELAALIDSSSNLRAGSLVSAVELGAEDLGRLSAALAKRLGSGVRLNQRVDPALLGGFIATVGDKTYDASLRGQLDRFKKELI